jgi:excisionase family DNA binding protein
MPVQTRNTKDGSESGGSKATLLRVPEVAKTLAISVRSVWRLITLEELGVVRIGKAVRITGASLDAFIAKGGTAS